MKLLTITSILSSLALAHFELTHPSSIGFSDDDEDKAPCGGFTPDFTKNVVDFPVGGAALAMRSTHQQGNWLFRGTLDEKAEKGWKQMFPIVMQTGLGDFCEPSVPAPPQWAGKNGVVSIVSSATDGLLYQCVAVNFVSGTGERPSECRNGTSKASFTTDDRLAALVDNGGGNGGNNGGSSSTGGAGGASSTRTASPQATSSRAAAGSIQTPGFGNGWAGSAMMAAAMALIGGFLLA